MSTKGLLSQLSMLALCLLIFAFGVGVQGLEVGGYSPADPRSPEVIDAAQVSHILHHILFPLTILEWFGVVCLWAPSMIQRGCGSFSGGAVSAPCLPSAVRGHAWGARHCPAECGHRGDHRGTGPGSQGHDVPAQYPGHGQDISVPGAKIWICHHTRASHLCHGLLIVYGVSTLSCFTWDTTNCLLHTSLTLCLFVQMCS